MNAFTEAIARRLCAAANQRVCHCGAREGLHRWGDEACPNPRWKPGNGQSQWQTTSKFSPRAAAVSPLQNP